MFASERLLEAALHSIDVECDARVSGIRATLSAEGEDLCVGCDEPIDQQRRVALPSAERCIECQRAYERTKRSARDHQ